MTEKKCPLLAGGEKTHCGARSCIQTNCQLWWKCKEPADKPDKYSEMWEKLHRFIADTIGRYETDDALVESRVHGVCVVEGKMVALEKEYKIETEGE